MCKHAICVTSNSAGKRSREDERRKIKRERNSETKKRHIGTYTLMYHRVKDKEMKYMFVSMDAYK